MFNQSTYKLEVFNLSISIFLEQQVSDMKICMIKNIEAKLASIWLESLHHFA